MAEGKWLPSLKELFQICSTFFFTMIAWVFFRSESVTDGLKYLSIILTNFSIALNGRTGMIFVTVFIIFDWIFRLDERNPMNFRYKPIRWTVYIFFSYLILSKFRLFKTFDFIYFQF